MFERFARTARTAVENAREEVATRGDRRIGTDHLLLALLREEALARIVGVDHATALETADRLDREALEAVGLTLGDSHAPGASALGRRVPLTPGAKSVLRQAVAATTAERARAISSRHLLLAVLDQQEPDPAAALVTALAVDRTALRDRLSA